MRKTNFFTKDFLDACENELVHQFQVINRIDPFAHPAETTEQERRIAKIFYNRLLFLLYQGGRISNETYVKEFYIVGAFEMEKATSVLNSKRY